MPNNNVESSIYLSNEFLQRVDKRAWRIALLTFDKILLPIKDVNSFFAINPIEKYFGELLNGKKDLSQLRKDDIPHGVFDYNSSAFKMVCGGDHKIAKEIGRYLLPIDNCGIKKIEEMMTEYRKVAIDPFWDIPIPHIRLNKFLAENLPANKYNNTDTINSLCLIDLLIGARLRQSGGGTILLARHDYSVMNILHKSGIPFIDNKKEIHSWTDDYQFHSTTDFIESILSSDLLDGLKGVDNILKIEVPSFEEVPLLEIIKYKQKDKKKVLVTKIREFQQKSKSQMTYEELTEIVLTAHKEAFDILRPTKSTITLSILGSLPTGPVPINPFSLMSLGQDA